MRVQILLVAVCAVTHGAPNDLGGFRGPAPFPNYGAPAPPSPFSPSSPPQPSFQPGPPAPVEPFSPAPSPEHWAPAPAQPPAHYSPPQFSAPAPPPPPRAPEAPVFKPPHFTPSQPAPPEPFHGYGASAPAPEPAHAPAHAPAPAPRPVPAPLQPVSLYGAPSFGHESAESSEEAAGLTDEVVSLSSAKTIKGKTLSDGRIQSLLSEQVNSHDSGGSAHVETSANGGYSFNAPPKSCQGGAKLNSNGVCEKVKESSNYYLFDVPEAPKQPLPPTQTHEKKLHYNVLLVRVPTESQSIQNINLSKDEQKTLVYVVRDPPKGAPTLPAPVTEAYKPVAPAVFYVTPDAKAAPPKKEKEVGYGDFAQEEPLPSPPNPGHGYSNNPAGW